ncbi:MAG: hypothetical protein ACLULH_14900 [Bacteroides fragilis]
MAASTLARVIESPGVPGTADKCEEEPERCASRRKLHRGIINAFGRDQQAHDVSAERFGESEEQESHDQQEQRLLNR